MHCDMDQAGTNKVMKFFPFNCVWIANNRHQHEGWWRIYMQALMEAFFFGQYYERLRRFELDPHSFDYTGVDTNTKQQLRGILKAARTSHQSSVTGSVNPDDEPSTSRQAQDGLRRQSKSITAVDSNGTLCKQGAIECHVPNSSDDSINGVDVASVRDQEQSGSSHKYVSSTRTNDWSCWTETQSNSESVYPADSLYTADPVVTVDRLYPLAPSPDRGSFWIGFVSSLCDWFKCIAAGFE
ncbi:GL12052 [Drosophila persimilis]|uniref:GL12052 n=1 Tax=Drosophila persimilis TaxID=7234 RepID=B4GLE0_DROPE|nr:GL12052 [Drosophila persimilis]